MDDTKIENYYEQGPAHGGAPKQLIFLLHGVGSNGQDLISLAPYWAASVPDAMFISPDAPFVCDMVPAGYPNSYQWFSLQSRDPVDMLRGVQQAQPIVEEFMTAMCERHNVAPAHVALVGFSQGTMMSLYVGPRMQDKIAGVLGYSGALMGGGDFTQTLDRFHKIPVCLIHGEDDDVVPVEAFDFAKSTLQDAGFPFSGHKTPGLQHSIDEKGIEAGSAFLKDVLS